MKTFKDFHNDSTTSELVTESRFLSKGFALTQFAGFRTDSAKINSSISSLKTLASKIKSEDEILKKLDLVADAFLVFAAVADNETDQRARIMNTVVAEILLSHDIKKMFDKYTKQNSKKSRG